MYNVQCRLWFMQCDWASTLYVQVTPRHPLKLHPIWSPSQWPRLLHSSTRTNPLPWHPHPRTSTAHLLSRSRNSYKLFNWRSSKRCWNRPSLSSCRVEAWLARNFWHRHSRTYHQWVCVCVWSMLTCILGTWWLLCFDHHLMIWYVNIII